MDVAAVALGISLVFFGGQWSYFDLDGIENTGCPVAKDLWYVAMRTEGITNNR